MADFRLGRLKFNWRGAWAPSTAYVIDDLVSFKGNTYVCVVNHTSAPDQTSWASTDLNIGTPRWQLHVPGVRPMGTWAPNTFYAINDLISYGANQYLCTNDHTSAASEQLFYSSDLSNWSLFTSTTTYKNLWSAGTWYKLNDITKYGNTLYITTTPHLSSVIFDETKFSVYLESINFEDTWSSTTEYQEGDIVAFGGYTYISRVINTNKQPNLNSVEWDILTTGFSVKGDYDPSITYVPGDVVQFGGNTFVKVVSGPSGDAPIPVINNGVTSYVSWELVGRGLAWKENWDETAVYQINDVVKRGSGSYVSLTSNNTNNIPENDDGTNWQALASGESVLNLSAPGDILYQNENTNVPLSIGNEGEVLSVIDSGEVNGQGQKIYLPAWERNNWCANVYYVATDGTDDPDYGKNISKPWKTIRYALAQTANQGSETSIVTIFVKSGTYLEQLPLVTTPYTSIVGDNLRATVIGPDPNTLSTDLTPVENRHSTMFFLSESVTLKDLVMTGMEGFTPVTGSDAWDITQGTVRGVFLRLHPDDAITGKSPYITQCSAFSGRINSEDAFSGGGVGAIIDKSIYSVNSNGSMLFDSFTQFHDGGVGFWCKDLGNAEIVSSFTYYCHIGYTCTGGGRIRSLAGNNSYGTYGCVSSGTDATEIALTGSVRGQRLDFAFDENSVKFKKLEQVVQGTLGTINTISVTKTDIPGEANADYGVITPTIVTGLGTGAQFTVTRDASGVPIVTTVKNASNYAVGSGYSINDTITIKGAEVGGTDDVDDIIIVITDVATDFSVDNDNYALALILYTQEASEDQENQEIAGDDYLLIEPITGTFQNGKAIQGVDSEETVGSGATGVTDPVAALGGITGKIFTLTGLPVVDNQAVLPKKTGSTNFLPVPGTTQYNDTGYYVIQDVTDPDTAQTLSLSTLRQYDVPGTPPDGVEILQIEASSEVVTVYCSGAHGLSTGDKVVISYANPNYEGYGSDDFGRETVTIIDGIRFTYPKPGVADVSPAVSMTGSKVYKQRTSGGSTKALHTGGSSITLYNVSSSVGRLERLGTSELPTGATTIGFRDPSVLDGVVAGVNSFILINNEMMRISAVDAEAGVTVVRGQEGTTETTHAEGSAIYILTKVSEATTLRGDVDTALSTIPLFSISNFDAEDIIKIDDEFFRITSVNSELVGQATITFSQPKSIAAANGQEFEIRLNYSQVRLTGHDFLLIGTGNKTQTNWPNAPLQSADQKNEVIEDFPGRVYYVSTDQDGNFRVGTFFKVEQATGAATLDANAFDLSGLASLRLGTIGAQLGAAINEFSTDVNLGGDFSRDSACPTQLAVKTYVDNQTGAGITRTAPTIGVASLSSNGTIATVTSFVAHNVYKDDRVIISGAEQANYNGEFVVTNVDTSNNSFTYIMPGAAVSPATGPINCVRLQKVASELDIVGDLKVRPTWNSGSETFNALQIEVTDTNSQIASKVIDAKVAGSSVFSVDKGGNIVAAGDLQVLGDLTTISSTNLTILDKEVVLASNQSTDANVNGAGIKLGTTTKGFTYNYNSGVNPRWDLSDGLNLTGTQGLYMAGSSILSSTTLGSSVVNSSLESVGVLEGLSVDGLSILKTISEDIVALSGATGTVNHDFGSSAVFYHTGINANFTCNLIGVPTTQNKAYSIALILNQGATGRIPNSFAVNSGTPITINWSNGATPVANANKIDIVAFSLVNVAGTFVVYGQLSSFG